MNEINESQTLVGIIAEGSEDWSREFLLDDDINIINSLNNKLNHNNEENKNNKENNENNNQNEDENIFDDDEEDENEEDNEEKNHNNQNEKKGTIKKGDGEKKENKIIQHFNFNSNNNNNNDDDDEDWEFEEISPLTNNQNILEKVGQSDNNNNNNVDDNDDEDWDIELGIADEIKEAQDYLADGLRLVINDMSSLEPMRIVDEMMMLPTTNTTESLPLTIPARCKLASNLLSYSGDINLVIYPKPPSLYTLKLDHSRKQYTAVEFDGWLQNIVSKHLSRIYTASQGKDIQWLSHVRAKEKSLTIKLISSWLQYIQILWRNNSIENLITALSQFSQVLSQYLPENKEKNQINYNQDDFNELFEILSSILRIALIVSIDQSINHHKISQKNSFNGNSNKSPSKKKLRINFQFQILLTSIKTSLKINSLSEKQKINSNIQLCCYLYHQIFQSYLTLFPFFRDRFALLELQCASYFITMMIEHNIDVTWLPKPTILLQCYVCLYQQILKTEKKCKATKQIFSASTPSPSSSSSTLSSSPSTSSSST